MVQRLLSTAAQSFGVLKVGSTNLAGSQSSARGTDWELPLAPRLPPPRTNWRKRLLLPGAKEANAYSHGHCPVRGAVLDYSRPWNLGGATPH